MTFIPYAIKLHPLFRDEITADRELRFRCVSVPAESFQERSIAVKNMLYPRFPVFCLAEIQFCIISMVIIYKRDTDLSGVNGDKFNISAGDH